MITIDISTFTVSGQARQIIIVNDITLVIQNMRSIMQAQFSQKLTASLCHEIMTPLNQIINISDILKMQSAIATSLNAQQRNMNKKQYKFIKSLTSSAKFMKMMLCSQLSSMKLQSDQLCINMKPLSDTMLQFIDKFLEPYKIQAQK